MKQDDEIHLDLPAQHKYLGVLSACIAEMLSQVNMSDREITVHNVQLAAHEIAANIIDHAYESETDGRIIVKLNLEAQPCRICIDLYDTGLRVFDPTEVPDPDLEKGQIRGYGLFLVRQLVDEVTYTLRPGDNHWRLSKNL